MKRLILLLVFTLVAHAQDYSVVKETVLAAAAEVITVQQPASGALTVRLKSAYIDCSVACTITLERNGTVAAGSTITPAPLNAGTAKVTAWSSSTVGTGTVISKFTLPAGGGVPLDLSGISLIGNGTGKNFTIRTSSITGTVHVNIKLTEVAP